MIITLTLNPAYDVHGQLDEFTPEKENLVQEITRQIGGKGINTSRALTENGIKNHAFVLLGNENAEPFLTDLTRFLPDCRTFLTEGRIRENITLHPKNQKETRISFRGFTCSEEILLKIEDDIPQNATLVFSGSLPPGIMPEVAEAFLLRQKDKGCRLVVDSKSISPAAVRRIRPWLIKPNAEEAEALFGNADWETAALALHREGVENVLVSLGEKGAFLATEGHIFKASAPAILPLSTIGAGDSMIAGFLACNGTPEERLKTAVAYGSAACLTEGTTPPTPDLIQQFL